jgi:hypothetical protein
MYFKINTSVRLQSLKEVVKETETKKAKIKATSKNKKFNG